MEEDVSTAENRYRSNLLWGRKEEEEPRTRTVTLFLTLTLTLTLTLSLVWWYMYVRGETCKVYHYKKRLKK